MSKKCILKGINYLINLNHQTTIKGQIINLKNKLNGEKIVINNFAEKKILD